LADNNEKDLPTQQSPAQTDSRLPRPDGHTVRTQGAQAPARQRPDPAHSIDSAQTARLTPRGHLGLSPANRLRRHPEFVFVQRHGVRFQTPHFAVYAAKLPEGQGSKLGMTVSRRFGNAVVRNRLRRQVRECYRLSLIRSTLPDCGLVVAARVGAAGIAFASINEELGTATLKLSQRLREQRS
jgi:ribonuclease P protein component